jgi:hypothetical protein
MGWSLGLYTIGVVCIFLQNEKNLNALFLAVFALITASVALRIGWLSCCDLVHDLKLSIPVYLLVPSHDHPPSSRRYSSEIP